MKLSRKQKGQPAYKSSKYSALHQTFHGLKLVNSLLGRPFNLVSTVNETVVRAIFAATDEAYISTDHLRNRRLAIWIALRATYLQPK
jgi:hypothetical protein